MRILISNYILHERGGTESYVRDLARGLQSLGHTAIAYTSDPTHRPRLLENDLVPVATDLENLSVRPDIIHAQHHLDAITALSLLPGVPAIFHSHGATWKSCPPSHPRIYRYVAITQTAAERMAAEAGIPLSSITVVPNGVDMLRFGTVRHPPARLARALFYSRYHQSESPTVAAVREATARAGVSLDFVGLPFGSQTTSPETLLPTYDLVFAAGISAIEALACGCAVVLLGRTSCGELVRRDSLDRDVAANFTISANASPPSAERVSATLAAYSPDESAAVSAAVRTRADFRRVVGTLLGLYEQAVASHRSADPDPGAEMRAMAHYLRSLVPLVKMTDRVLEGEWSSPTRATSFEELRAELGRLERRIADAERAQGR